MAIPVCPPWCSKPPGHDANRQRRCHLATVATGGEVAVMLIAYERPRQVIVGTGTVGRISRQPAAKTRVALCADGHPTVFLDADQAVAMAGMIRLVGGPAWLADGLDEAAGILAEEAAA